MDLYTDGASRGNPGKSGAGILLVDGRNRVEKAVFLGRRTNNEAEYLALIEGVKLALARGAKTLRIFMDSQLAVRQLTGQYKVKNARIIPLHREVKTLLGKLNSWSAEHVPREKNKDADRLSNLAIDDAERFAKL